MLVSKFRCYCILSRVSQDCNKCHTKGKVNCQTCEGHGQIRCYIQLSITWKVSLWNGFQCNIPHWVTLILGPHGRTHCREVETTQGFDQGRFRPGQRTTIKDIIGHCYSWAHVGRSSASQFNSFQFFSISTLWQVAFEEEGTRVQPVDLDSAFSVSGDDESQSALIKGASASLVSFQTGQLNLDL